MVWFSLTHPCLEISYSERSNEVRTSSKTISESASTPCTSKITSGTWLRVQSPTITLRELPIYFPREKLYKIDVGEISPKSQKTWPKKATVKSVSFKFTRNYLQILFFMNYDIKNAWNGCLDGTLSVGADPPAPYTHGSSHTRTVKVLLSATCGCSDDSRNPLPRPYGYVRPEAFICTWLFCTGILRKT